MNEISNTIPHRHSHVFLGEGHEKSERKTWAVIWLCGAMMIAEILECHFCHQTGMTRPPTVGRDAGRCHQPSFFKWER